MSTKARAYVEIWRKKMKKKKKKKKKNNYFIVNPRSGYELFATYTINGG